MWYIQAALVKIAFLTTDNRENSREYHKSEPYFGTAPEALLQGLAEMDGVEVHVMSCVQQPMSFPAKLAKNTYFHGLVVPKIGWLRTGYQGCIRAVRAKLKSIQPKVVHGQGTERDCAISAIYSGFPSLITIHGNMRLIAKVNRARPLSYQWLAARLERWTLPRAAGVICITRYTQRAVQEIAQRTWVIPNAADSTFFQCAHTPQEPPTLLCIGNISYRKNQIALVEALDPLAERHPFELLFLGGAVTDDAYAAKFFQLIAGRPWCKNGGMADRAEVKRQLSRATMLILPSLEDNCPMVVLEAMAVGTPVIAPNVGGVPDLVQHGVNGLLCDPTDPASIREQVELLLSTPKLRYQLGLRGNEEALRRFEPRVIAREHLKVYASVAEARAGATRRA
jgi:glycosyltransferase involved in cell wall biosynthesis